MTRGAVRRRLASPTSWLIVGSFALLSGIAFVASLNAFMDLSSQALTAPPAQPLNVNRALIRPFLLQAGLAALLVLPFITAREYRQVPPGRSLQRAVETFAGTLALYAVMLLAPLALVAVLFLFGAPEWPTIASGYLGLLLTGAAFISVALFISSLATTALAAGFATFAISLMVGAAAWLARTGTPAARALVRRVSAGEGLDDFAKGVIDTGHVVSCLTIVALGLYLTHLALERRSDNRQLTTDD